MTDSDKIKMNLNIGDQRITLSVPFARQEFTRNVEQQVDSLYRKWRHNFPAKTDRELLAMVAYQYASFYNELKDLYEQASDMAEECVKLIDTPTSKEED